MRKIYEELASMLIEYRNALSDDDLVNLTGRIRKDDQRFLRATERIEGIISAPGEFFHKEESMVVSWWRQMEDTFSCREIRFIHLRLLLDYLDDCLAYRSKERHLTQKGVLVLGKNWWRSYTGKCADSKFNQLDNPNQEFLATRFFNIRLSESDLSEWIEASDFEGDFNETLLVNGKLKFGLCSLDGTAMTHFKPTGVFEGRRGGKLLGFRGTAVKYQEGERGVRSELQKIVDWAKENKVNVLAFPELSICPKGEGILLELLNGLKNPTISLVYGGSFHRDVGNGGRCENQTPIIVRQKGQFHRIDFYGKTETFTMPRPKASLPSMRTLLEKAQECECDHLTEDIAINLNAKILPSPIGYIGVDICKDALDPFPGPQREKMVSVIDHLFVLSMNLSPKALFREKAIDSGRAFGYATYYVNAAQVMNYLPEEHFETTKMQFWWLPSQVSGNPVEEASISSASQSTDNRNWDFTEYLGKDIEFLTQKNGRNIVSLDIPRGMIDQQEF